jgi:hypothetical protein
LNVRILGIHQYRHYITSSYEEPEQGIREASNNEEHLKARPAPIHPLLFIFHLLLVCLGYHQWNPI